MEGVIMSRDSKLFDLLSEIEWRLNDMKRTEVPDYFEECYQDASSKIEEAFRLLGWEG